jgi:protein-L-isoaspartate(D-aspartate) O-methyltransferase
MAREVDAMERRDRSNARTYWRRGLAALLAAWVAPVAAGTGPLASDDAYVADRRAMVGEVQAMVRSTSSTTGIAALSPRVTEALLAVPRHRYVPPGLVADAYENRPLPIGHGQTISQPFVVALMTELAAVGPRDVVLEVGTGSGYQAAVLGRLAARVYTIEIVEPLAREAEARLAAAGERNVEVAIGDGYRGLPDRAPFDAIVVTAGAPHVPKPLLDQLKPGGRLVIPLDRAAGEELVLIAKRDDGSLHRRTVLPVRFVPLTGPGVRGR